jgi:hypothetical protein
MSAEAVERPAFDESHFTPEHFADFAYRRARGCSWEVIAHEFNHPSPDRLRRTLEKDDTFRALVLTEKRTLRDEAEADALYRLRVQTRDNAKPELAQRACQLILEFTTKQAERENKLQVEETRAKARIEVETKRAETKAEKKAPKVEPVPSAVRAALKAPRDRVFLYGNEHPTHTVPPDHTDTPVQLMCEVVDGVDYYYVMKQPVATVEEWERANMVHVGPAA